MRRGRTCRARPSPATCRRTAPCGSRVVAVAHELDRRRTSRSTATAPTDGCFAASSASRCRISRPVCAARSIRLSSSYTASVRERGRARERMAVVGEAAGKRLRSLNLSAISLPHADRAQRHVRARQPLGHRHADPARRPSDSTRTTRPCGRIPTSLRRRSAGCRGLSQSARTPCRYPSGGISTPFVPTTARG